MDKLNLKKDELNALKKMAPKTIDLEENNDVVIARNCSGCSGTCENTCVQPSFDAKCAVKN